MLRLMLLRHAKSDWSTRGLHDIDRPFIAGGREGARRIGAYLAGHDLVPDAVLISPAARTRETWTLVAPALTKAPKPKFDGRIYEAPPQVILAAVRETPASAKTLLVIGHNPGMQSLALALIGSGDPAGRARLSDKFPTAGLAVIDFAAPRWSAIQPTSGTLDRFVTPRALAESGT
jgi:phosphohistidine phosphatase